MTVEGHTRILQIQISSRLWQGADVGCVLQQGAGEAVWQRVAFLAGFFIGGGAWSRGYTQHPGQP